MGAHWQDGDHAALRGALARLLPEGAGFAVCDPRLPRPGMLYPVEAAAMARAVPARLNTFTAGRVAARAAMAMAGLAPAAIPMGEDRAPVWPDGVTGSISHCDGACIAVAARTRDVPAIGVDVEEDTDLDPDLWDEICTQAERVRLMALPGAERGRAAKRLFCAKEAIYKAIYPRLRRVIGFHDLEVDPGFLAEACLTVGAWVLCVARGQDGTFRMTGA